MKQILFLLLFPCLAMAQYPGNAGQKITLGEQTSADGLVYRGLAADTTRKPSVDTMAFILLDTNTNIIWQYKKAVNNAWTRVGGSISSGVTGVLPVANGGTNTSTLTLNKIMVGNGTSGVLTPTDLHWDNSNGYLGIGIANPSSKLMVQNTATIPSSNIIATLLNAGAQFQINVVSAAPGGTAFVDLMARSGGSGNTSNAGFKFSTRQTSGDPIERMRILSIGEVNIGYGDTDNGAYPLQVNGQIFATNATIATSDEKFKENIIPLSKGLEIVDKLKPVTFNFIPDTENNFSEYEEVGFIAQDVDRALSTETFAKSIVKAADDSEPTSTMGLATQNLIHILVKAIQEQQSLIKALEQRILILENK